MPKSFRRCAVAAALCCMAFDAAAQGAAAAFPVRPIRWIVPFPPGGAADIVSRVLAQKLGEAWGHQVVIDNRPGAGGNVGTEMAARATPDGQTVVLVPATFTTYPSLVSNPVFDPIKDFAPITLVSTSPLVLVVHPAVPARNVKELIALARAKPRQLNYASSGIGASAHMAAELFRTSTGTDIVHVPYKGQPPALLDVMSGRVQIMFPNIPASLPHIKSGKLRALAVTTAQRASLFPDLPTVAEAGLPGFEVTQWSGLLAPAGTPAKVAAKFQQAIATALKLPDVHATLERQGFDAVGNTPQQFAGFIRDEIAKWARVIRSAGIKAE